MDPRRARRFGSAVRRWFRRGARPLPWRISRDPYRIWIAEILLQQTRVGQATPFYERFVRRFPDVRTLARAPVGEVLKAWQGAGYYARARHLAEAARVVVRCHDGVLPRTVEELEQLPGVGPYTARAIAALAYDAAVVPLDANVLRVAARWTCEERPTGTAAARTALRGFLDQARPSQDGRGFVEGLMELGETVCTPRAPRCNACPVAWGCRAVRELEDASRLPRPAVRPKRPHLRAAVVVLNRGDRWLVQRRPPSGLLGGLWEFPGGKLEPGERPEATARRELREETGARVGPIAPVGVVAHAYSHFTVELHVFRAEVRRLPAPAPGRRWVTPAQLARLPVPRATERIVALLRAGSSEEGLTPAVRRDLIRPRVGAARPGPRGAPDGSRRPGPGRRTGGRASPEPRAL